MPEEASRFHIGMVFAFEAPHFFFFLNMILFTCLYLTDLVVSIVGFHPADLGSIPSLVIFWIFLA